MDLLDNEPLEILVIDDNKILAGGRISLRAFKNFDEKFKRGNFHLFDQFN
jgi:hypothetical protein